MSLPSSDLSELLLGSFPTPPAPTNLTDILSGLAGLSSIAGGFDHAVLGVGDDDVAAAAADSSTVHPFVAHYRDKLECGHFTSVDQRMHFTGDVSESCRFWTEGVASLVVAAFGLAGNFVSIWVLSAPEMRNPFNQLLMALAVIDCFFIAPGILIYTSKAFAWRADWYNYAFPVFLYPFSEIALCSSIYMTVAIAVERYIGLCRPLQRLSGRPGTAKAYIIPAVLIAVLLNVPKFLESETVSLVRNNATLTRIRVTELRTHPHYITYYWMWTRLLATGIIPLTVLAILNSKIYLSIRHSKQQLRILAIRSALPMAILSSQNVTDDLMSHTNGNGPGSTTATATSATASSSSPSSVLLARGGQGQGSSGAQPSQSPKGVSPLSTCHHSRSLALTSSSCTSVDANGNNGLAQPNGTGRGTGMGMGSGRPRGHMQRSVSAFDAGSSLSGAHVSKARLSKAIMTRSHSTASSATTVGPTVSAAEAAFNPGTDKLAPVLFGVVVVFVVCNSLRVILNVYDFTVVEGIIVCEKKGVGRLPPAWILCSISVSHLLLMLNSSVNFLVYCMAGTRFRRVFVRKTKMLIRRLRGLLCCAAPPSHPYDHRHAHLRGAGPRAEPRGRALSLAATVTAAAAAKTAAGSVGVSEDVATACSRRRHTLMAASPLLPAMHDSPRQAGNGRLDSTLLRLEQKISEVDEEDDDDDLDDEDESEDDECKPLPMRQQHLVVAAAANGGQETIL